MFRKKSFFLETIIYEILVVLVSAVIFVSVFIITGYYLTFAHILHIEHYQLELIICLLFIHLCLTFIALIILQKKRQMELEGYMKTMLEFLNGEIAELPTFHESLGEEWQEAMELKRSMEIKVDKMEAAYRDKRDMLTYLAHDIKTPLANMVGYGKLLEEDLPLHKRKHYVGILNSNLAYLNELSEVFFTYLKFNLNEVPINPYILDVRIFFNQWLVDRAESFYHRVELNYGEMDFSTVETDPQILLRILENLMSNSEKYASEESSICITISCKDEKFNMEVTNSEATGDDINWNQATDKFYHGFRAGRYHNSSGLGLTIVRDMTRHLSGEFKIGMSDNRVVAEVKLPREIHI